MIEPAFTAASYSENTEEESSSLPPEITIGIDLGTWPCCISVWNDSEVELWKKKINETMKISFAKLPKIMKLVVLKSHSPKKMRLQFYT
ncbi:hypothetical protein P8452_18577 [Trifolium repens]|jgi:hypothetical protein|nr:hypothetical protein P8452_18577 [Trifolium repens]